MRGQFQFNLRAVFATIAAIAVLLGLAVFRPPESTIVAVLVFFGGTILLLGDISRARFRGKYATLHQCDTAYRRAIRRARIALWGAAACASIGAAVVMAGHEAGWLILVFALFPAFASRGFFNVALLFQRRWVEISQDHEQLKKELPAKHNA